jgi:hypothetical protein
LKNPLFNPIHLSIVVGTATPANQNLEVDITMSDKAVVMEGSIFTNLPAVSGTQVQCSFIPANGKFTCKNVAPLSTKTYDFRFRAYAESADIGTFSMGEVTIFAMVCTHATTACTTLSRE